VYKISDGFVGTAAPVNWHRPVYELDVHDASNNGYKNEDLIVWMRAAAFPSFRKLYRRVNHSSPAITRNTAAEQTDDENAVLRELFTSGLPAGNYTLTVGYGGYIMRFFKNHQLFVVSVTSSLGLCLFICQLSCC